MMDVRKSSAYKYIDSASFSSSSTSNDGRPVSPRYRLMVDPAAATGDFTQPSGHRLPLSTSQDLNCKMNQQHRMDNENNKSFVVLDDLNNNNISDIMNIDNNFNAFIPRSKLLDIPARSSVNSRQSDHINWMPPWYNAPSSI
uniref:Uncharacterized protein n=1 Tax=Timema poppense TaxID=170557 RepID=A0A7R9DIK7_TIMPO|nr:unnamed protein product [Timema poppensis]